MANDTPTREPFDVERRTILANKFAAMDKWELAECFLVAVAERDAALARLALAEKVIQAAKDMQSATERWATSLAFGDDLSPKADRAYVGYRDALAAFDAAEETS